MKSEIELRHLEDGAALGENPSQMGTVRFEIRCPGNAEAVLRRCKEVMHVIIVHSKDRWPNDEEWRLILPEWFVVTCAKESSKDEAEQWLARWRTLNPEQQANAEAEKKWSLPSWIYWFRPAERLWFWWDAEINGANEIRLAVEVSSWPFPWGALRWLCMAAGALSVRSEN